jgi:hypothetical protein
MDLLPPGTEDSTGVPELNRIRSIHFSAPSGRFLLVTYFRQFNWDYKAYIWDLESDDLACKELEGVFKFNTTSDGILFTDQYLLYQDPSNDHLVLLNHRDDHENVRHDIGMYEYPIDVFAQNPTDPSVIAFRSFTSADIILKYDNRTGVLHIDLDNHTMLSQTHFVAHNEQGEETNAFVGDCNRTSLVWFQDGIHFAFISEDKKYIRLCRIETDNGAITRIKEAKPGTHAYNSVKKANEWLKKKSSALESFSLSRNDFYLMFWYYDRTGNGSYSSRILSI